MSYAKSSFTTSQMIMSIIGIIVFVVGLSMGFAWAALLAWNFLAAAAGWSVLIPVTWKTVLAAMMIISLIRYLFNRNKN